MRHLPYPRYFAVFRQFAPVAADVRRRAFIGEVPASRPRSRRSCFAALFLLLLPAVPVLARDVDVVLLGGQSNADGRASTNALPFYLQGVQTNVLFYHGNADGHATVPGFTLTDLQPGGSSGSAGTFGPEVSMGYALARALTNTQPAIIKYANGGTTLAANWALDSGADYTRFTNTVTLGLQALRDAGHTPHVIAMTWLQGESDGANDTFAAIYESNLTAFIERMRSLYGEGMSFVIAQIHNGGSYPAASWTTVQQAQTAVAEADTNAAIFTTYDLRLMKTDNLHYEADGLVAIGERFAKSITNLLLGVTEPPNPPEPEPGAPILYYPFDTNFLDASASSNHALPRAAAALTHAAGEYRYGSGGLELTGADTNYVQLTTPIVFGATNAWTIAFWCKRDETGAQKGMILGEIDSTDDFIWLNDNFEGLRFRSSTAKTHELASPKDRVLHHYVLVANGEGDLAFYLDGTLQTNSVGAGNTAFRIDTIGQAYTTNTLHYALDGTLDDVYVFAEALSSNAVHDLYLKPGDGALLLYYPFDSNMADASSMGDDGTAVGDAAVSSAAGDTRYGGGGLVLDGEGDRVELATPIAFSAQQAWSVSVWARLNAPGREAMILGERATTDDFIWLNDSFKGFRFRSSTGDTCDFNAGNDTRWHHYALVADGESRLTLYVDNWEAGTIVGSNTAFRIDTVGWAYSTGLGGYEFDGAIDELRVYGRALSPWEVAALYKPNPAPREVLRLPFDGDFNDASGNRNDGMPVNEPVITTDTGAFRFGAGGLALGGGNYLELTAPIRFAPWAPWSVAFWAKWGLISSEGMVIGEHGTHDDFIWLNENYTGFRMRNSLDNAGYDFVVSKNTDLHHYALTADGLGSLKLYVDGEFSSGKVGADTRIILTAVGSAYNGAGFTFNGSLDEVRVYEGELSSDDVAALYTRNGLPPRSDGTVLLVR